MDEKETFDLDDIIDELTNRVEDIFEDAIAAAEKYNVPLYCGEYGVIELAPKDDTKRWLADIHSVLEKHGIGRAVWNYKGKDFGIIDSDYGF